VSPRRAGVPRSAALSSGRGAVRAGSARRGERVGGAAVRARRAAPALAAALLLIGGCAGLPPAAPGPQAERAWAERLARLEALAGWRLSGKLAVRAAGSSWAARLRWWQRGGEARVRLAGPLGQGLYELRIDPSGARLRDAAGRERRAESAEALLRAETGRSLPIEGLRYWIEGRPRPGEPVGRLALDEAGRVSELSQSGWRIRYRGYRPAGRPRGLDMPRELELTRALVRVRVLVRDWRLEGGG